MSFQASSCFQELCFYVGHLLSSGHELHKGQLLQSPRGNGQGWSYSGGGGHILVLEAKGTCENHKSLQHNLPDVFH